MTPAMPHRAFVSNDSASEIQVVELETGEEFARITLDSSPFGMALSPDGCRLWAPLDTSRTLAVIDTPTGTVLHAIPMNDPRLVGAALAPDGRRAFVLSAAGVVYVIDASTMKVTDVQGVGGENTERMRLTPDGAELWVAHESTGRVAVLDTRSLRVVALIDVGESAADIAFTPDGTRALIPDLLGGEIVVVDRQSHRAVSSVRPSRHGGRPRSVAAAPGGSKAYVTLYEADEVIVVDLASNRVSGRLQGTFDGPNGIALAADGTKAVVANQASGRTSIVDLARGTEIASLPFPGQPRLVVTGEVPAFERIARR